MGIGSVWGYNPAWIAGAIISGAYFGDKVSPLSDTTVLASSSCGVELFTHIRYLMWTSIPAMALALIVFGAVGLFTPLTSLTHSTEMIDVLHHVFNITPWTLIVPGMTIVLIVMRCNTLVTLGVSTLMGIVGMIVFQPDVVALIAGGGDLSVMDYVVNTFKVLCTETSIATGDELLDSLVSTGGIEGMMPTIYLILSAMVFGGVLMGSGMLGVITHAVTHHIKSSRSTVITTVGTGLMLNACTGDQYLSIILNGNLYRNLYHRNGLEPRLLSRSIEDSTSVTSVLIPWNSCGLTQSAVLGVATLHYLPYCVFNIASPLISIATAWVGFKIKTLHTYAVSPQNFELKS
jgi:NhaC family Na+:H+ antiporter